MDSQLNVSYVESVAHEAGSRTHTLATDKKIQAILCLICTELFDRYNSCIDHSFEFMGGKKRGGFDGIFLARSHVITRRYSQVKRITKNVDSV